MPPPKGPYWQCRNMEGEGCGHTFDTFKHKARCPSCGRKFKYTMCINCGQWSLFTSYFKD